jgi:hypothetical protein
MAKNKQTLCCKKLKQVLLTFEHSEMSCHRSLLQMMNDFKAVVLLLMCETFNHINMYYAIW